MRDYSPVFDEMPYAALEIVRRRLGLPRNRFLDFPYETLTAGGRYCAADAAVALAGSPSAEAREALEAILGRPLTVCPPCLSGQPAASPGPPAPRVLRLAPNPRLPATPAHGRYALLHSGMRVDAYLSRVGHYRGTRDLREWSRRGDVTLS